MRVFGWEPGNGGLLLIIAVITAFATISVVTGLDRGIKRLSQINIVAATLLAVIVLVVGPTVFLLFALVENTGNYIQNIFNTLAFTGTYAGEDAETSSLSLLVIFVVVIFFVTSSDSGSFVVDMLTSGGDLDPSVETRVFWAVTEGLVASALLLSGEEALTGLQAGAVSAGFPFAIVLVFATWSLLKGLRQERGPNPQRRGPAPPLSVEDAVRRERARRELELRQQQLAQRERELDIRERELDRSLASSDATPPRDST